MSISGPLSDRFSRKPILLIATLMSSFFTIVFLNVEGWLVIPILLLLGFSSLSTTPVMLAMVQDQMPNNRAMGNGIFMVLAFFLRSSATLAVGFLGDTIGLRSAYTWSALIALISIPAIYFLPCRPKEETDL